MTRDELVKKLQEELESYPIGDLEVVFINHKANVTHTREVDTVYLRNNQIVLDGE